MTGRLFRDGRQVKERLVDGAMLLGALRVTLEQELSLNRRANWSREPLHYGSRCTPNSTLHVGTGEYLEQGVSLGHEACGHEAPWSPRPLEAP